MLKLLTGFYSSFVAAGLLEAVVVPYWPALLGLQRLAKAACVVSVTSV
jgi:hypothetical protein